MKQRWYIVIIIILTCLFMASRWQLLRVSNEIERSYVMEVTLQTVDAKSNQSLPMALVTPAMEMGQRWPRGMTMTFISSDDPHSKVRLRWIGIDPINVVVGSTGYKGEIVTLDKQSQSEMVVSLSRGQ
jgi:hypothetical protein